jgi:hypothetical protein
VENNEITKLNLKIQALGESFSNKAVQYENQIADLRVELTLISQELEQTRNALNSKEETIVPQEDEK